MQRAYLKLELQHSSYTQSISHSIIGSEHIDHSTSTSLTQIIFFWLYFFTFIHGTSAIPESFSLPSDYCACLIVTAAKSFLYIFSHISQLYNTILENSSNHVRTLLFVRPQSYQMISNHKQRPTQNNIRQYNNTMTTSNVGPSSAVFGEIQMQVQIYLPIERTIPRELHIRKTFQGKKKLKSKLLIEKKEMGSC